MRYSAHRSTRISESAYEVADLDDAIWRAMELIKGAPRGAEIYIRDAESARIFRQDEIRHLASKLPPQSQSTFGGDDG
jgi:hypothetical protein